MNQFKYSRPGIAFVFILALMLPLNSQAQHNNFEKAVSIKVDGTAPDSSAMLDINSNSKGILVPRMTTTERLAISTTATGLLVFDTDSISFFYYNDNGWTKLITDPTDSDSNPSNEIQDLDLSGNTLSLTSDASTVNLVGYLDNTDAQTLTFNSPDLSIAGGNSVNLSSLDNDDWDVTSGTNITNNNDGNVGIGNIASSQNRWQLSVKDTVNSMLGSDSIDVSELFAVFTRNLNENNTGIGIGFQSTSTVTGMGAAIVHERTSSNSRGKLHFATKASSSAASEDLPIRMTLDETGDLGIGITSPTSKLHVSGGNIEADRNSSTSGLGRSLTLGGARSGDSNFGQINFENYDSDNSSTDYVGASIRANNGGDASDNGNLRFLTYNGSLTEQVRITEEGLVGIGETSPQASLDVVDEAVIGNLSVGSESTDQSTSLFAGTGFTTTPWLYTNAIEAQGERAAASTLITLGADGTYGVADEIHFVTSGNNQMQISSDGKVGIDKDPDSDIHIRQSQQSITNGTGGVKFEDGTDPTDYWRIYHSGIFFSFNLQGSRVAYVNTNGAWTVDSDASLKKNIGDLGPTLERVIKMRPVNYHYNEQKNNDAKSIGFIAQEVKPLFPEMVVEGEDGKLGMTYATSGVIAIKAIQEQQKIIDEYKAKVDFLEKELMEIKTMLSEKK